MALAAFVSGFAGFELSRHSIIALPASFAEVISPVRHDRFMAVWFAHCASYLVGLTGGALLVVRIWNLRGRPRVIAVIPRTRPAIIRALVLGGLVTVIVYIRFVRS
jgi:hypothetical protein